MADIISPGPTQELFGNEVDLEMHKSFDMRGLNSAQAIGWFPSTAPTYAFDPLTGMIGIDPNEGENAIGEQYVDFGEWPVDNTTGSYEYLHSTTLPATPPLQASEILQQSQSVEQLMAENARLKALLSLREGGQTPSQAPTAPQTPPQKPSLPQTPDATPRKKTAYRSPSTKTQMSPAALAISQQVGPIEAMWGAGSPHRQCQHSNSAATSKRKAPPKTKAPSKRASEKRSTASANKVTKVARKAHQRKSAASPLTAGGGLRSLEELYASPFATLTKEEKALILLPLIQGIDPVTGERLSLPGTLGMMAQLSELNDRMNSKLSTNFVTDTNDVLCNNSIIDTDTSFQNNPTTSTDNTFNPTQMADTNFFDQTPTAGLNTTFAATPSIKSEDPFHTNTSTYQNNNYGEVPQDFVYYGMVNGGFSMHDGTDLNGLMNDDGFGIDMGAYAMNTEMNFNTSEMVQQATAELSNGYATSRQNEALERAATLQQMGRRR